MYKTLLEKKRASKNHRCAVCHKVIEIGEEHWHLNSPDFNQRFCSEQHADQWIGNYLTSGEIAIAEVMRYYELNHIPLVVFCQEGKAKLRVLCSYLASTTGWIRVNKKTFYQYEESKTIVLHSGDNLVVDHDGRELTIHI